MLGKYKEYMDKVPDTDMDIYLTEKLLFQNWKEKHNITEQDKWVMVEGTLEGVDGWFIDLNREDYSLTVKKMQKENFEATELSSDHEEDVENSEPVKPK